MKSFIKNNVGEVITDYGAKIMKVFKKGNLGQSIFSFFGIIRADSIQLKEKTSIPGKPISGKGGSVYVKNDGKLYFKSAAVSEKDLTDVGGASTINQLTDVDTTGNDKNHILIFDGTEFKTRLAQDVINTPAIFTFSTQSFSSNLSTTELVGSNNSNFKAANDIEFTASYFPSGEAPNDAKIQIKVLNAKSNHIIFNNNAASTLVNFTDLNSMTATAFTSGTNSFNILYPEPSSTSTSTYPSIQFQLSVQEALNGSFVNFTTTTLTVSFANKIFSGVSNQTSLDETGIEALSSSISTGFNSSVNLNSTSGKFLYRAVPARYNDYHINYSNSDGSTLQSGDAFGFKFKNLTCPFIKLTSNLNITNSRGFGESYDVYRSVNSNLGNGQLVFSQSSLRSANTIIGVTTRSAHSDIEASDLQNAVASNSVVGDGTTIILQASIRTSVIGNFTLTLDSGHDLDSSNNFIKVFFAFPNYMTNHGAVKFNAPGSAVGGFSGGNSPSPHSLDNVENANGFKETYSVYIADNVNQFSNGTNGTFSINSSV